MNDYRKMIWIKLFHTDSTGFMLVQLWRHPGLWAACYWYFYWELAISCRYDSAVSFVWKSQRMGSCSLAIFCPATRTQSPIILLFIILRTSVQVGKT